MIKILIQKNIKNNKILVDRIKYTCNYIFEILGYQYSIYDKGSLEKGDIVIYYGKEEPTIEEMKLLARDNVVLFIPIDLQLLGLEKITLQYLKEKTHEMNFEYFNNEKRLFKVPIISSNIIGKPITKVINEEIFGIIFHFDIFSNIFFHLSNTYYFLAKTDSFGRILEDDDIFFKYRDVPFINEIIHFFEHLIIEGALSKQLWLIKKEIWPKGENFAVALTYSVDKLLKWKNIWQYLLWIFNSTLMFFYNWKQMKINFKILSKFITTRIEPYWKFNDIQSVQKNRVKGTFFIGSTQDEKKGFDYTLEDDLLQAIRDLIADDNEIALLGSKVSYHKGSLKEEHKIYTNKVTSKLEGIRQSDFRYKIGATNHIHHQLNFSYDSSLGFISSYGFKNGVCLPYRVIEPKLDTTHFEFPITFSDNVIKSHRMRFDSCIVSNKTLIETASRYKGLVTFGFNISNFDEIDFEKKWLQALIDYITSKKAYIATLSEITNWWNNRNHVILSTSNDLVSLVFPFNYKAFSLSVKGNVIFENITYDNHKIDNNIITFYEIPRNAIITFTVIKAASENINENSDTI